MNTLPTLIKLQKAMVDEQRQLLARLQAHLDHINQQVTALQIEQAREQIAAKDNPHASLTYGAYVKRALVRQEELARQRVGAAAAVDLARDKLAELFETQKRYEIVEQHRATAAAKLERKQETTELDEIGSIRFAREKRE